jgi:hypothetical protein
MDHEAPKADFAHACGRRSTVTGTVGASQTEGMAHEHPGMEMSQK